MVMATFGSMTDEVVRKLAGFTLRQDRQTHVVNQGNNTGVSSTATNIKVASAQNISTGIIQIDDELIYVDSYDRASGTLNIPPYGRGYNGTEPATHQIGARVIISPTFPTVDVKGAINETIEAVFPDLYTTGVHTFLFSPSKSTYALPEEVETVLAVSYETTGPTKEWLPVRGYRVDPMANVDAFGSRNSITLLSGVESGRTVQIFYTSAPTVMDSNDDDFEIVTGLPASCKDVIVLGATARLASFIDPGRLTFGSAESDQQSQIAGRAYGAGTNASKYLLALFDKRLSEETRKLQDRNPIRIHFTR
jgi:hypothetical protein